MARLARSTVYINGLDLASIDFELVKGEGWADAIQQQDPELEVPGRSGRVLASDRGTTSDARILTLALTSVGLDSAAAARDRLRTLAGLLGSGLLEVRSILEPTLMQVGRLESLVESIEESGQFLHRTARATARIRCADPFAYDVQKMLVAFGAVPIPMPGGTAPVSPELVVVGPTTSSTWSLTYRDLAGNARVVMGFTLSLAAGDHLLIDCDAGTIRKSVAGTESDAYDAWTTTTTDMIVLDPADGDMVNDFYGTLEVAGLAAGGAAYARYRRAFR